MKTQEILRRCETVDVTSDKVLALRLWSALACDFLKEVGEMRDKRRDEFPFDEQAVIIWSHCPKADMAVPIKVGAWDGGHHFRVLPSVCDHD